MSCLALSYTMSEDLYIELTQGFLTRTSKGKSYMVRTWLIVTVTCLAMLWLIGETVGNGSVPLLTIPLSIGFALLTPKYCRWSIKQSVTKQNRKGNLESILGHIQLEISEDQLCYTNVSAEKSITFNCYEISKIEQGSGGLVITFNKVNAIIIPDQAFNKGFTKDRILSILQSCPAKKESPEVAAG